MEMTGKCAWQQLQVDRETVRPVTKKELQAGGTVADAGAQLQGTISPSCCSGVPSAWSFHGHFQSKYLLEQ